MAMDSRNFEQIASVGMGRMGRGIAITFAFAGMPVSLIDAKSRSSDAFVQLQTSAHEEINTTLKLMASFGMLKEDEIDDVLNRVTYFDADGTAVAIAHADLIFEAVPETLDCKKEALGLIGDYAKTDAIVASTTSTILSDELQKMIAAPERFLNAHWLNPAYLVPLVELSPGAQTDSTVTDSLKALLERIGKVPVVCAASPGL